MSPSSKYDEIARRAAAKMGKGRNKRGVAVGEGLRYFLDKTTEENDNLSDLLSKLAEAEKKNG